MAITKIPFDHNGNLLPNLNGINPATWRPNNEFAARMTLDGAKRGQSGSAAVFVWRDDSDHEWPMFLVDVANLMKQSGVVEGGVVEGRWVVVKRGTNYGLAPAPPHKGAIQTSAG